MRRSFFLLLLLPVLSFAQTAVFPNSVVTDGQLKIAANGIAGAPVSILGAGISASDTAVTVIDGTLFPANTIITLESEKLSICAKSGNVLTVGTATTCPSISGRGFDGTTAAAHGVGTPTWLFIDAWYHNATRVEIEAVESYLLNRHNYKQVITNAVAPVVISPATHGQGNTPTIQCWSNATPARLMSCDLYMDPTDGTITLNASAISPFSGFVIISAGH